MNHDILHERRDFRDARALIEWAGREYSERIAYSFRKAPNDTKVVTITFREFRDDVRALASELLSMGCAGKHLVVIGKFSYDFALMYFATFAIGAVLVPLDRDWHAEDLADTAEKAGADFLFCDEDIAEKAEAIAARGVLKAPPVFMLAKTSESTLTR